MSDGPPAGDVVRWSVLRTGAGGSQRLDDELAVERPLELRIDGRALSITLRTPGHDDELALGFLATEGVIGSRADVAALNAEPAAHADVADVLDVRLAPGVPFDWTRLERRFAATAACGLCGRTHAESLHAGLTRAPGEARFPAAGVLALGARVRPAQSAFARTGGLHAAAWCDGDLEPRVLREDVGRHNAVDKVCGWLLGEARYGRGEGLLWVSGRAGAEIVLKAARASIPVLVAVGAPSSLAVELATTAGLTLVGFAREGRMNVYTGAERLLP